MGIQKIVEKIEIYVKAHYKKIPIDDFVLGEIPYNHRCHLNSVQKIEEGNAKDVILCYAIDEEEDFSCVHFINQLENGKYQDNTWGWKYKDYDYYLIKYVDKSEYKNIGQLLINTKQSLFDLHTTWFDKYILKLSKNII